LHVRDALRERGIRCETVTGKTPDAERRQTIQSFRSGKIQCLTGADIFIHGFDIAQIDLIALLRPTLSTSRYVQMLGRGTRKADGKGNCLVLDFGGNVLRHGPVDNPTIRIAKNENNGGSEVVKVCPHCKTFNPIAAVRCIECDQEFPRQPIEPTHAGTAGVLPILTTDASWINARIRDFDLHTKAGRPPCFKITYRDDGAETYRDWLAFAHGPGARWHAVRKWQQLGGAMPAPADAHEALRRKHELARDIDILTTFDGKFWQISRRRVRTERAA
jgi:DNA repair protein RadD